MKKSKVAGTKSRLDSHPSFIANKPTLCDYRCSKSQILNTRETEKYKRSFALSRRKRDSFRNEVPERMRKLRFRSVAITNWKESECPLRGGIRSSLALRGDLYGFKNF